MKINTGITILISIMIIGPMSGCIRQSPKSDKQNSKDKKTVHVNQSEDTTDIVEMISSKNIFAIPTERNVKEIEFTESASIIQSPPQSLTITGIALDGGHYILSVENTETKERKFLIQGDEMGDYKVHSILYDRVEAIKTGQKDITLFSIGDQVELPGTASSLIITNNLSKEVPIVKSEVSPIPNSRRGNRRAQKSEIKQNEPVKNESSDMETELRERRKKQEEELQ